MKYVAVECMMFSVMVVTPLCSHLGMLDPISSFNLSLKQPNQVIVQGDSVELKCRYNLTSDFTFRYLKWLRNDHEIYKFYDNFEQNKTNKNYNFKINESSSDLRVRRIRANRTRESENFTCEVQFLNQSSKTTHKRDATALLKVIVPVKDVTIFYRTNEPTGDVIDIIAGEANSFTCVVPNIHPAASVEWTLGNEVLKQVDSTSRVNESTRLTTTTSTVALTVAWENHNEVLSCRASNMEGQTGKSDNVSLDVKVLPTNSSLHLFDENGPLANGRTATITARPGKLHIFFFEVNGTRPKASIDCYLGKEPLQTFESTTGGENELINTTSVFHINTTEGCKKQLKCLANTTDSKGLLPSIEVTLIIKFTLDVCAFTAMDIFHVTLAVLGVILMYHILRLIFLKYYLRVSRPSRE